MSQQEYQPIAKIPGDDRLTTYPISRPGIWKFYKQQVAQLWVAEEISLGQDKVDYSEKLTDGQRLFLGVILTLFATLDKLVNINIAKKFKDIFGIYEIDMFYDAQTFIENIHAEVYSQLIDTYILDENEKLKMINGWKTNPAIHKIVKWIQNVFDDDKMSAAEAVFRMVIVEGVVFPIGFVPIYWITDNPLGIMKGLGQANELIARDETLHKQFGVYLQTLLTHGLTHEQMIQIIEEARPMCYELAQSCVPIDLPEMNKKFLCEYADCLFDAILLDHNQPVYFKAKNPFAFMERIMLNNKTNFFERQVTEYVKPQENREYNPADTF